jgi:hypothetical protein
MSRKRVKVGNIYEIPLPDGKKAYGRLFKEGTLAIYKETYDSINDLPEEENYRFFVIVYDDLLRDGQWPVVGFRPFESDEDAWPPPTVIVDALTHIGELYYKGQIIPCKYEECKDLEVTAVWDRHHVVDRLMGDTKWLETLRRPINPDE